MPTYHVDALDINESLDYGVASCAVRAFAAGLLIRHQFPNDKLFQVEFGFAAEHGDVYEGKHGRYVQMGHAVTRLWVPEQPPLVVESFTDSKIEVALPEDRHEDFTWMELTRGYKRYLEIAGLEEVEVDPDEILKFLLAQKR